MPQIQQERAEAAKRANEDDLAEGPDEEDSDGDVDVEDTDEEDPFAEIDEGFDEDDLEANLMRDKYARLTGSINSLIDELSPAAPDFQLRDACEQLVGILGDAPEMHGVFMGSHGMLAILEVLESRSVALEKMSSRNPLSTRLEWATLR